MQFLCQKTVWTDVKFILLFGIFKNQIQIEFRFSAHPYYICDSVNQYTGLPASNNTPLFP